MKYPQLVSTHAVNAISDWLISKLEQLGVDAPEIYSRLLLSLLNSSIQINDPLEFNNLEHFLLNKKGSKRIHPCNAEKLKKMTAVQCLMDVISSEHEVSNIEAFIDELRGKLNDIENKNISEEISEKTEIQRIQTEVEDPTKRYYRAFPALSKNMENSSWPSKKNFKNFIWPSGKIDDAYDDEDMPESKNIFKTTAGVKRKTKRRRNQVMSKGKSSRYRKYSSSSNSSPNWDTDFEGAWEMGHDLIQDFLVKEKGRNRSTSESDTANISNTEAFENHLMSISGKEVKQPDKTTLSKIDYYGSIEDEISAISESVNKLLTDNDDEIYDIPLQKDLNIKKSVCRRLFDREPLSELNDLELFTAKFDSSVEALWKKNNNNDEIIAPSYRKLNNFWNAYNYTNDSNNEENCYKGNDKFDNCSINTGGSNSTGIFVIDSIWSNIPPKDYNNDKSYYADVLVSSLSKYTQGDKVAYDIKDNTYSYNNSKWSECIFEAPFIPNSTIDSSKDHKVGSCTDQKLCLCCGEFICQRKCNVIADLIVPENMQEEYVKIVHNKEEALNDLKEQLDYKNGKDNEQQESKVLHKNIEYEQLIEFEDIELFPQVYLQNDIYDFESFNHSDKSQFIDYSICKNVKNIPPIDYKSNMFSKIEFSDSESNENLLTADRTHFCPIKSDLDLAHTIIDYVDDSNFHRSASGNLYYDSEKYFSYIDEFNASASTTAIGNEISSKTVKMKSNDKKFTLKFRAKQIEKSCQTDDTITKSYLLKMNNSNNAIFEETLMSKNSNCFGDGCFIDVEEWSMAEVEKRCLNNNNVHTLWGMCPTCSKHDNAVPANRLLKDELDYEAEEIMSDLRYMQSLYIGSDWEDYNDDNDDDFDDIESELAKEEFYQSFELSDNDEQEQIFFNITKLLSDLLKTENAKSLVDVLEGTSIMGKLTKEINENEVSPDNLLLRYDSSFENQIDNNENNINSDKCFGGLWSTENAIWRKELTAFDNENIFSLTNDEIKNSSFLEENNWQHFNLAKIWKDSNLNNNFETPDPELITDIKYDRKEEKQQMGEDINLVTWDNDESDSENYDTIYLNQIINRFERKRRHSTSQNFNINIKNEYHGKFGKRIEHLAEYGKDNFRKLLSDESGTTYITCKYWTTMDMATASALLMNNDIQNNGIETLAINHSSIFEQVAVAERPLTR